MSLWDGGQQPLPRLSGAGGSACLGENHRLFLQPPPEVLAAPGQILLVATRPQLPLASEGRAAPPRPSRMGGLGGLNSHPSAGDTWLPRGQKSEPKG